ncbi:MAG: response regulator transcription factor [Clostridia bacterium]|nr:response regulator transcription factor [Clostridia bacterium]
MNKTIYIVEDDDSIREMIQLSLTYFSYEVVAFSCAEDALAAVHTAIPDMVIFDIMLPGMNGLDAVKSLRNRAKTRDLPVIILTAKDTELDKVTGLDSGADDYIAKPFSIMELSARIRSVLRRASKSDGLSAGDSVVKDFRIDGKTREIQLNGVPLHLSFKEYELLCMLIHERARIVPREELINAIWGYDFIGESRTLDNHIRSLRIKLNDDANHPRYLKTYRNVGYRFIGE